MPGNPKIGAFILAAGEGRRLRPATFVRPKAIPQMADAADVTRAVLEKLLGPDPQPPATKSDL